MKVHHLLAALALGAAIGTTALAAPMMRSMSSTGAPTKIHMKQQNGSKQTGTATLRNVPSGVQVEINLTNEPAGASEPAHIHSGSCAVLNPHPSFSLSNVVNGHSLTTLTKATAPGGVSVASLTKGHYAINVHESLKNLSHYVSCGDLFGAH